VEGRIFSEIAKSLVALFCFEVAHLSEYNERLNEDILVDFSRLKDNSEQVGQDIHINIFFTRHCFRVGMAQNLAHEHESLEKLHRIRFFCFDQIHQNAIFILNRRISVIQPLVEICEVTWIALSPLRLTPSLLIPKLSSLNLAQTHRKLFPF